jgi:peptidyl-prolyl cis-trans isomerase C
VNKTITATLALALSATIAVAQPAPAPKQAQTDPIVVAAGNVTIRQSEFENALKTLPAEYQQFALGPGKKQFAEDYLRMKMLAAEGMKAGLDKDADVVRQLDLMRENLVANAQLQKMEQAIAVPAEDVRKQYDENKAQYEQVKARHILVAFKGSPAAQEGKPELTEEQAKAKAEDLRKQIVGGASFEDLAKKESDDVGSGANGGELGEFGRGQMVPEFEKAAFEAKAGDITPVVRTQFGYHIIKVDEHTTTPFEEVSEQLERTTRQKKLQAELDRMKADAKVTYNEAYFTPPAPAAAPQVQPASNPK